MTKLFWADRLFPENDQLYRRRYNWSLWGYSVQYKNSQCLI